MSKYKLYGNTTMSIEDFVPVYTTRIYRRGVLIKTIKSGERYERDDILSFVDALRIIRHDRKCGIDGNRIWDRLCIVDNYGYIYTLQYYNWFDNIVHNYRMYQRLKAQLEQENQEVVMTTADGEKHYNYTFSIVRRNRRKAK